MHAVTVNWVNSERDIPSEFFDICFPPPLEGRWWYHALENTGLESQFEFAYALISIDGKLAGIAPTFLMNVPMELVAPPAVINLIKLVPFIGQICPFLIYQRTLFIGSPCADEGTVGMAPGFALPEVLVGLQDAVLKRAEQHKAPMIVWKDFRGNTSEALERAKENLGMFQVVSYPGTTVMLTDNGLNGYYDRLKGSRRHNLKKKLKRSKERLSLDVEIVDGPSADALDEIFQLFWQTYERAETKLEKLNLRFFELIAQVPVSRFVLLREQQTQRLVAFMLCFQLGDTVINKFIGLDYSIAGETHLYFRLWQAALEWVISTGAHEFQSGQTGYRAKIDVVHELVPLSNYCKHRNPVIHKIYEKISSTISWSTIDKDLKIFLNAHPDEASG